MSDNDLSSGAFRERITNIERRRVGDIDHNPRNPKRYEKQKSDRLTAVLQQFGKSGVLLTYFDDAGTERFFDGNTRKRLGDDEVWYIAQTDLTQKEVDDLVMLYDPLAAPDWEAEMLKALANDTAVSGNELELMIEEIVATIPDVAFSDGTNSAGSMSGRAKTISPVIPIDSIAIVEGALKATGERNRGLAFLEVCRSYLIEKGQHDILLKV